ncbi:cdkn1a interacting zinc finger protein 1a isoform X2 [Engraulis encrasicolus]|uniref:cdkn1a interacting zinc finger protein 1a isoform X2 n=1 Tax=Engraulis encrasicolus TaxID=184585 RepID=UPI002FD5A625
MFNPHHHHHQQQQQFHQHVRQLQQLFQQQRPPPPPPPPPPPQPPPSHHMQHHHQSGRPIAVAAPAPPPPRMVNLCPATQAAIIAPNPMLQGALLMQQMQGGMRGFAMGGQQFPQFFPAGSRSSLLGPVPMGVAIKTPHIGFAPRHFNPHARYMNNDYASRQMDRKRENEQKPAATSEAQQGISTRDEAAVPLADGPSDARAQQQEQEEPAQKKARTEGAEGGAEDGQSPAGDANPTEFSKLEEGVSAARPVVHEVLEQSRAAQGGEKENGESQMLVGEAEEGAEEPSKEVSSAGPAAGGQEEGKEGGGPGGGEGASNKYYCYICNITCHNQQNFQGHMNGLAHQQRMMEIQHMSNACLVTLLPKVQESLQGTRRDGEKRPGLQRWCAACQTHFTCNVMEHRRTKEHKLCSRTSSPCCTPCRLQFRTSREFVEHMQTPEHQQKVQELRERRAAGLEDLTTLDEKGCFVGEEELEEKDDDVEDEANGQAAPEVTLEDMGDDEEFDSHTIYGSSFLVPAAGFLCRLCNRFYHFESTARHAHCKSQQHFDNLKKYRALRKQQEEEEKEEQAAAAAATSATTTSGADAPGPEDNHPDPQDQEMTPSHDQQGGDTSTHSPPALDLHQDQEQEEACDLSRTSTSSPDKPPNLGTQAASTLHPTAPQEDDQSCQLTQATISISTSGGHDKEEDDDDDDVICLESSSSARPAGAAEQQGRQEAPVAPVEEEEATPEAQKVAGEAEVKLEEEEEVKAEAEAEAEEVVVVPSSGSKGRGRGAAKRKGRATRRR